MHGSIAMMVVVTFTIGLALATRWRILNIIYCWHLNKYCGSCRLHYFDCSGFCSPTSVNHTLQNWEVSGPFHLLCRPHIHVYLSRNCPRYLKDSSQCLQTPVPYPHSKASRSQLLSLLPRPLCLEVGQLPYSPTPLKMDFSRGAGEQGMGQKRSGHETNNSWCQSESWLLCIALAIGGCSAKVHVG